MSDVILMDDESKSFTDLLVASDHAGFISNSLDGIPSAEIVDIFGSATVSNYQEDQALKDSHSYREDAHKILARIRRIDFLLAAIDQNVSVLASDSRITLAFKELLACKVNTTEFCTNIFNDALQETLSDILDGCANEQERLGQNGKKNRKSPLSKLRSHVSEFSQHAHYFAANKGDEAPTVLLKLEAQRSAVTHQSDSDASAHQLSYAQQLSKTGLLGLEDIALEALGGTDFIKKVSKHFCEVAMNNRRDHGNDYREFYIRFGTKHFKRLVAGTVGAVLFSFDGLKEPGSWTPEDAKHTSDYVYSRYQIVHDVIEGLADRKKNPLGGNLTKEQTNALMCETLRSAIYPGYKLDIRVGIGGTHQSDVLVRVGSYVMNALDTMAVYGAASEVCAPLKGVNVPSLTLVSGAALAERVNGLDPVSGKQNEQNYFNFIGKFIASYYPELSNKVIYASPTQQEVFDNDLYKSLLEAAKEITKHKTDKNQEWSETYEKRSKAAAALTTLTNFASKRKQSTGNEDGAKEMALKYAVAHIMPSVFRSIRFAGGFTAPVWKIGGRSEKHFNAFGEALVDLLSTDERFCLPNGNYGTSLMAGICTTTPVGGNPPPYYKGPKGSFDPALHEITKKISSGSSPDKVVIERLQSEDSGPAEDMRALLTHKRLGDGDIARGWSNYKSFLMNCEY